MVTQHLPRHPHLSLGSTCPGMTSSMQKKRGEKTCTHLVLLHSSPTRGTLIVLVYFGQHDRPLLLQHIFCTSNTSLMFSLHIFLPYLPSLLLLTSPYISLTLPTTHFARLPRFSRSSVFIFYALRLHARRWARGHFIFILLLIPTVLPYPRHLLRCSPLSSSLYIISPPRPGAAVKISTPCLGGVV